jgi:hypothetical protein
MRGLIIFTTFFTIFLASTLAIPSPLFPGNIICLILNIPDANQASMASAITNGIIYGSIAWVIFSITTKWIENNLSKNKLDKKSG